MSLTAFLAYISRFYLRLDSMSRIVSVTQKAAAGAKRIFDILDHVSSVPEPASPVHLAKVSGRIELRGEGSGAMHRLGDIVLGRKETKRNGNVSSGNGNEKTK